MSGPDTPQARPELRRTGFTAATIAFLIFLYLFSPFTQTFLGWFVDFEDNISHRVHEVTFGALFSMIFVGVLLQLRDPIRYGIGLVQALVGAIVLTAVVTASTGWEWTSMLFVVPLSIIAWLHPNRRSLFRLRFRPRRSLVVLMLLMAGPLLDELTNEFSKAANEASGHQSHWGGMAAYALVILILGLLAAFRVDGWRVLVVTTSVGVALIGALSLAFSFDASAAPALPALLALIWAVVFTLYARRAPDPADATPVPDEPPRRLAGYLRPLRLGAGTLGLVFLGAMGLDIARDFTPPNVPHSIESTAPSTCLACHLTGDRGAPVIDLDYHGAADMNPFGHLNCRDCHGLPAITRAGGESAPARSQVHSATDWVHLRSGPVVPDEVASLVAGIAAARGTP